MKKILKKNNCSGFNIIFKEKFILIFFYNKLFLKQYYIKNKIYTFFFICFLLYKFGFFNILFKKYSSIYKKNVHI